MEQAKPSKTVSRRKMLSSLSWTAGSLAAGYAAAGISSSASAEETKQPNKQTFEYKKLDPEKVADRAYEVFPEGGCMYGPFAAIILEMADQVGEPFASFPIAMARYGFGGAAGWGTLCGTLNGSGAMFGLFTQDKKVCGRLCDGLFQWYRDTPLPVYQPKGEVKPLPKSVAGSVLCHVSSARWCMAANCEEIASKRRKLRCRCLAADVAKKATELLNAYFENQQLPEKLVVSDSQGSPFEAITKMNCGLCHSTE